MARLSAFGFRLSVFAFLLLPCVGCAGNRAKVAETISAKAVGVQVADRIEAKVAEVVNAEVKAAVVRLTETVESNTTQAISATNKVGNDLNQAITTESTTTTGVTGPVLVALSFVACLAIVAVWYLKTRIYKVGYHADNWEIKRRGGESRAETLARLEQTHIRERKRRAARAKEAALHTATTCGTPVPQVGEGGGGC